MPIFPYAFDIYSHHRNCGSESLRIAKCIIKLCVLVFFFRLKSCRSHQRATGVALQNKKIESNCFSNFACKRFSANIFHVEIVQNIFHIENLSWFFYFFSLLFLGYLLLNIVEHTSNYDRIKLAIFKVIIQK